MHNHLKLPAPDPSGLFIPTLNKMGYMTTQLDPFSQEFVKYAAECQGLSLEIGAAYGIATLAALSQGATIVCNDLDTRHLELVKQQADKNQLERLQLVAGSFPDELTFPENYFSAILICRVLHLFDGPTITHSLHKIYQWLKPGGKIFIVADTPYLKNFKSFIPIYEDRINQGIKWPGLITDPKQYDSAYCRIKHYPKLINFLDDTVLTRILLDANFIIEKLCVFSRSDYPEDRRLDGRECVGAIAFKL